MATEQERDEDIKPTLLDVNTSLSNQSEQPALPLLSQTDTIDEPIVVGNQTLTDDQADIKPSVVELRTNLSKQTKEQSALSPTQTVPTNGCTEVNIPVGLKANQDNEPVGEPMVNFGWEQIKQGPLLPFIKRGPQCFVACPIVIEKVFKNVLSAFSPEVIRCITMPVLSITQSEAETFNEINITHCDRCLVGSYIFTPNDYIVDMESIKKFVTYFHTCRNLIIGGVTHNPFFGFIRIDGENEVPFVWHGNQMLVPLFYFEGIDAEVIDLVDNWEIGYLKFCFKAQKIKQDLYKDIPFKVIDFKKVEAAIAATSTLELCVPKNFNQELLTPELRNILPLSSAIRKKSAAEPCIATNAKRARAGIPCSPPSYRMPGHSELTTSGNLPNQALISQSPRGIQQNSTDHVATRRLQELANVAHHPVPVQKNTPKNPSRNVRTKKDTTRNSSRRSPQVTSSQEFHLTSRFTTSVNVPHHQQQCLTVSQKGQHNIFERRPVACSDPNFQNSLPISHSASHIATNQATPSEPSQQQNVLDVPAVITQNNGGYYQQENVMTHTARSKSADVLRSVLPSEQLLPGRSLVSHIPTNPSTIISLSNSNSFDHHQSEDAPGPSSIQIQIQRLAAEKGKTSQNMNQSNVRQQTQGNFAPKLNSFANENQQFLKNNSYVPPAGYQTVHSSKPVTYQEQYANPNVPLVQNINVAVTNVVVAENNNKNHPGPGPSKTSRRESSEAKYKRMSLKFHVPEHIFNIDTYSETYIVQYCPVGNENLLGIRASLVSNNFLINCSEFAEKVLKVRWDKNWFKVTSMFKTLYKLNYVQQEEYDKVRHKLSLKVVGEFTDLFVGYTETINIGQYNAFASYVSKK